MKINRMELSTLTVRSSPRRCYRVRSKSSCGNLSGSEAHLMRQGRKIAALKALRERKPDLGIKEAKDEVERWQELFDDTNCQEG